MISLGNQKGPLGNKTSIAIHLLIVSIVYIFSVREFLFDTFALGYDNAIYNFPNYLYYADSIRHGYGLPRWYPYKGGIDTGIASMNLISLVPHRIMGYILYTLMPLRPITLYKTTIVLGMIIIGTGWWFFLYQLIGSKLSASVGCLAFFLSGSARVIFHMEQDLATMAYIPYLMLTLMQIKRQFSYILVFAVLLGYALTAHYPFHGLLTVIFVFLALLLTGKLNCFFSQKPTIRQIQLFFLASIFCILSLSPSLYISKVMNSFSSTVRQDRILKKMTFEDYQKMGFGGSSVTSNYFFDILRPLTSGDQNGIAFKLTRAHLVLSFIGIFYFRFSITVLIVLGLSIWATLGLTAEYSLPYYLFKMHFPFISYFRQWYHFFNMALFCLSILSALGMATVLYLLKISISRFCKTSEHRNSYEKFAAGFIALILTVWMYNNSRPYFVEYTKIFYDISGNGLDPTLRQGRKEMGKLPRFDKRMFLRNISSDLYDSPLTLFMNKTWWDTKDCFEKMPSSQITNLSFSTWVILNDTNLSEPLEPEALNLLCNQYFPNAVIASIPDNIAKPANLDILDITSINSPDNQELIKKHGNRYFNGKHTPTSLHFHVSSPTPHFAVIPYNYKLGLSVYINQQKADTYSVYNGAMTGVFVPAGNIKLDYFMPFSSYQASLWLQGLLFLFILIFIVRSYKSKTPSNSATLEKS